MLKRFLILGGLVLVFLVGIAFWKYLQIQAAIAMGAAFAPQPTTVTTVTAQPEVWQPEVTAVGSVKAVNGTIVSTDLAGIVAELAIESGARVKKGDLLVKLDSRQEEAQEVAAEARLELARQNLARMGDLVKKKAVAESDYDTAESEFKQAQALMEEAQALIARKTIVAPFDGLLGIREVNVGQYLNVGTPIVPLQSLDPVYVNFALPQQQLDTVQVGGRLRVEAEGVSGTFEGTVTAIDALVDEATRNIKIQGTVSNTAGKLRPGMFVQVAVLLAERAGVIAIPATSISYAPYGDSVFLVKRTEEGETVEQKFVKLGPARGDRVSIESGVEAGDVVVTSGVFQLRPNAAVRVDNSVQPADEINPTPPNT